MRRILVTCGALLALGGLAACTGSAGGKSSAVGYAQADPAAAGPPVGSAGHAGSTTDGGAARPGAATDGTRSAATPGDGTTGGPARPGSKSVPLSTGEARILTADLTVDITGAGNVSARADAAGDIALRAGGQIDGDERSSGRNATATLRLRVPPAALQDSLQALSKLGRARARHLTSRDVTEQVADVTSRSASAQRAIARLRGLYDSAIKVSDVIAIEQELASREADLESLQAQQRALAAQTAMASITIYLRAAPATPPATHKKAARTGFLGGLATGWDAFTGATVQVATGLGAALPFLVLLVLLGAGLRLVWPRLGLGRRAPSPVPTPSE